MDTRIRNLIRRYQADQNNLHLAQQLISALLKIQPQYSEEEQQERQYLIGALVDDMLNSIHADPGIAGSIVEAYFEQQDLDELRQAHRDAELPGPCRDPNGPDCHDAQCPIHYGNVIYLDYPDYPDPDN